MKQILLIFLIASFSITIHAQSLTGKVLDEKGQPIFYATVALYGQIDSLLVTAESTDNDGIFKIKAKSKKYYAIATMLGYADKTIPNIDLSNGDQNIEFSMTTDANLLSTIEIVDKAPLLEQKADKLIVNVEGNITNSSGSLLDVMKKVPGMLVINDRLSMVGAGSPTIMLNGKTTQYMDIQSLLRDMPGDNIQKVEIIHQPGAEYDAAGSGPVINIILKKNSLFGTNGSVTVGVGKGELWEYNTGLNLSHYAGNFNVSGGIGYTRNAWVEELALVRRLTGISDDINGEYIQVGTDKVQPKSYRANLRLDWDVTPKHRIGLETKFYDNSSIWTGENTTEVDLYQVDQQDYNLLTLNAQNRAWNYASLNPYYIFEIDTAGQKLELDVSMSRYNVSDNSTLTPTSDLLTDLQVQRFERPGDTRIFASTIDYTLPLSKIFEIKTGLKYSLASLDNNFKSLIKDDSGEFVSNPFQSNHFLFDETIYAAYGKLNWSYNDWSGTAGLRYEDSESIGESLTLNQTNTRDISKFFPSFSVSRKIAGGLASAIAYSRRIDRPRYSTLNPFIYYLDQYTSSRGNPNLRPELTHSAKFTLTFDGQPFFNVEYKESSDAIVEVTEQEMNSPEAYKTDVNFDKRTNFSTSLFFPLDMIPGITGGYGGVIISKNGFDSQYIGNAFARSVWNTTAFVQLEFNLPLDINAELGGWYTSGNQEGIFKSEYLYGSSFGMSKKFLDGKAKLSFGVEDFVNRFWHANVDYQQDMDIVSSWQAPVFNMKFRYKFGNQHLKSKKKTAGSASEELRRASQGGK